jgi:hypothetical protein
MVRACIRLFQPTVNSILTTPAGGGKGTAYPAGKDADSVLLHRLVRKIKDPTETYLLVRDPIEKFRSACAMSNVANVAHRLTRLETEGFKGNSHFWPQSRFVEDPTIKVHLYKFEDIDQFALDLGIAPLPHVNAAGTIVAGTKPNLTPAQRNRVLALYADDVALYNSITHPDMIVGGE